MPRTFHYVFRRGKGVHELWDRMHHKRKLRLLYIAGRGFDVRAQAVMKQYVANQSSNVIRCRRLGRDLPSGTASLDKSASSRRSLGRVHGSAVPEPADSHQQHRLRA